jgi:DNA uptake protein ComE-like DNA-binding protein
VLLVIVFLLGISNKIIFYFEKPAALDKDLLKRESMQLVEDNKSLNNQVEKLELFEFNPNTIDSVTLKKLDIPAFVKSNLMKFRKKNGHLKTAADFGKIYGVTPELYKKIEPYLVFEGVNTPKNSGYIANEQRDNLEKRMPRSIGFIELNSTDSVALKSLPGIGDKLSKRIIKYRDLLGGFSSISQLKEVYGLKEQTIDAIEEFITIDSTKIKKLDLNLSGIKELAKHPYIQYELAGKIVKFRSSFGSIPNLSVLLDHMILNIEQYKRLRPYF